MSEPTNLPEISAADLYLDLIGAGEFDHLEGQLDGLTNLLIRWRKEILEI